MDWQDIDDELSATGAQELLASTSAAHLAYIGKDGPKRRPSSRRTITPRWVRYYDFGAGRKPRFLHELAEQLQS